MPVRPSRLTLSVAPLAALGLFYAALLQRGTMALAHLESAELATTGRALVFVVPPVAALLGWWCAAWFDGQMPAVRVLARVLGAGALAGALAAAAPIAGDFAQLGRALALSDLAQLGYVAAGAAAGFAFALPAAPAVLALLMLARAATADEAGVAPAQRARATASLAFMSALALAGAAGLIATRPRPARPDAALATRPPFQPGKLRGEGPAGESPTDRHRRQVAALVDELAGELKGGKPGEVERVILEAGAFDALPDVFAAVVELGLYDATEPHLRELPADSPALAALALARPTYGCDTLNADTIRAIRERRDWASYQYPLLIVPGYTPLKAQRPLPLEQIDAAVARLEAAVDDVNRGVAPYVLVSGGSVHPPGTPHNEALSMRDWLIKQGLAADRILVDPFARHSTTNLRNAGRLMQKLGMRRALIVTGFEARPFSQAFYFSHPVLSSFAARSRRELGFLVGRLEGIDDHRIEFSPALEVTRVNPFDPLDW